jgi:hypothetical protein
VKKREIIFTVIALVVVAVLVFGCAPGNDRWGQTKPPPTAAGFWAGVWHGFIIVVTFIVSLFTDEVGLYEVNNRGWQYDLGFVLGIFISMGWVARIGRKKRWWKKAGWDEISGKVSESVEKAVENALRSRQGWEGGSEEFIDRIEERIRRVMREWNGR